MAENKSNIYTVSFARSFLDALALKILEDANGDYLSLCDITIFLPNHRACKSLAETFLRLSDGKVMLLPKMLSLGDIDEDELMLLSSQEIELAPQIDDISRKLILSRLIKQRFSSENEDISYETSLSLASELAKLLDEVTIQDANLSKLKDLIHEEFAEHWQETLDFLSIITENWPLILKEQNVIEKACKQKLLIEKQIEFWEQNPPNNKVIMAGFANFLPAIARMMKAISKLKNGHIIFYGLDNILDNESYDCIGETHPQYGMKKLLSYMETARNDVLELDFSDKEIKSLADNLNYSRTILSSEMMRPSEKTNNWADYNDLDEDAITGLNVINFKDAREEALGIALMMREALEKKETTAALITPDRNLARRVASELERWQIHVNDSAGRPLSKTPVGIFILLTADMIINQFAPKEFLSAMKHPLASGGTTSAIFRSNVRKLELEIMRGIAPDLGFNGLKKSLSKIKNENLQQDLTIWLDKIFEMAETFVDIAKNKSANLKDLIKVHVDFLENLASTNTENGASRLWKNEDGEAAAAFISNLYENSDILGDIPISNYLGLLENLMTTHNVRSKYNTHSRLSILGLMEARLQRFDLVIMAGLNEGTWPSEPKADPFINRRMRREIGLYSPDENIGIMAYDFISHLCASNLIITRAEKEDGSPSNCSRWLLRLGAVLEVLGLDAVFTKNLKNAFKWQKYCENIDKPETIKAITPPCPCPPVKARPRSLPVTGIETLMRDPYAIYSKYILKLKALDPINAEAGPAEFGSIVHAVLADFLTKDYEPDFETLLNLGEKHFAEQIISPSVKSFWWSNFKSIARWFVNEEIKRRDNIKKTHCETTGKIEFEAPFAPFELYAIADRIDELKDNSLEIIDYKTGSVPTKKTVLAGFAPQLPLEVNIAQKGGFKNIGAKNVSNVSFWQIKGRDKSQITSIKEIIDQAEEAFDGLKSLIAAFDDEVVGYQSRPHPKYAPKYSDYQHLARVNEWSSGGDDE